MIFGFVTELAVGALCIVFGLLIWLKQKVSLIHDYQYKNVKKSDIPAYSRLMGVGLLLMGAGICVTGVFNLFESSAWWLPVLMGFVSGFIVMHIAQKKYNGSWFG